jgi:hypothetical protein
MKQRETFQSPYDQYAEHVGKPITTVNRRKADDYDPDEVGLMYDVVLADGTAFAAWPEEVFEGTGWEPGDDPRQPDDETIARVMGKGGAA